MHDVAAPPNYGDNTAQLRPPTPATSTAKTPRHECMYCNLTLLGQDMRDIMMQHAAIMLWCVKASQNTLANERQSKGFLDIEWRYMK